MPMEDPELYRFEALKLLKEWSTALVLIQTGAMTILGSVLKGDNAENPFLRATFVFFLASIMVAAHVIGAIPDIVQNLREKMQEQRDIYKMRNRFGISLAWLATAEHIFFALGIFAFFCFQFWR